MVAIKRPRFDLGHIVATPGSLRVLAASDQTPHGFLYRHVCGDWGDLSAGDRKANEDALRDGSRILSAYVTSTGQTIWIITEAANDDGQRASTAILLPGEY